MKQTAQLDVYELARTFNCGIGMLISVSPDKADEVKEQIMQTGEDCWTAGEIVSRADEAVLLEHAEQAWA